MSAEPKITPTEDGPYRIEGIGSIARWSDDGSVTVSGTKEDPERA